MKMQIAPLVALTLLVACSPPDTNDDAVPPDEDTVAVGTPTPSSTPGTRPIADGGHTLRLDGLGDLRVGEPVPSGSSFAERGAQLPGMDCRTISSPDYPGVYAITEGGEVRRISVGGASDVKLVEGIGPGSTEQEVMAAFPGFVATGHAYVEPPAKYLTQPGDDPRLRFEIDADGKVSVVHVGLMPQLGYVEGCA